ncbi:MAG TPA: methionine adenosyltransferase [Acidimicrobiales bacterium]|nr:methionine adenosyltransferase [Acidimicrobiales bacterium]
MDNLSAGLVSDLAALLPEAWPGAFDVELRLNPPFAGARRPRRGRGLRGDAARQRHVGRCRVAASLPARRGRVPRRAAAHVARVQASGAAGPGVKVMGVRAGAEVRLTVAAAVLSGDVADVEAYEAVVGTAAREAASVAEPTVDAPVAISVNADGEHPYVTLCGSSAEAGDDGQAGRGNHFGGLITPFRPMTLEACAGKNPISHVGKTYHAVAHDIAEDVRRPPPTRHVCRPTRLVRAGRPCRPGAARRAIPIGHHQVTTQPSLVAAMIETLDLRRDQVVLEVGTGFATRRRCLARLVRLVLEHRVVA